MKNVITGSIAALVFFALAFQTCEIRRWKNAYLETAVKTNKELVAIKASIEGINSKHDPAIAGIQADIATLKLDSQAIRYRIGALHVPTAAEVLAMAANAAVACEDRLAQAVASFTTCRTQIEGYESLTLSQDKEIKRWSDLDLERQAKDKESQAAFKVFVAGFEKQTADLTLAQQRAREILILYVGAGGSIGPDGKLTPALQFGLGIKIKGWRLWK